MLQINGRFISQLLPMDKLKQCKKEASRIELGIISPRFHRRTHCYSKSKEMLILSLNLFFKRNYILSLFN